MADPEKPKRPQTPWLRFLQDFRATTSARGKDVMSAAARGWRAMPTDKKRPYEAGYAEECVTYEKALKAYIDSGKKAAWEQPAGKPKKPMTAYFLFAQEYREKNPDMKVTELSQTCGGLWKQMTPADKVKFEQQYQIDAAKYKEELQAYQASGKEEEWKEKVGITAKEEAAKSKAEKKKAAEAEKLAKKKAAEAKKKAVAAEKKKAAAEKKKAAAEKEKAAAEKKKAAAEKEKAAAKQAAGKEKEATGKRKAAREPTAAAA